MTSFTSSSLTINHGQNIILAIGLYSVSIEDLATFGCFLALHKIKFDPKEIAKSFVDVRPSTQPAHSTSKKALNLTKIDFLNNKPKPIIF